MAIHVRCSTTMTEIAFRIGDVSPADDAVARFVTVAAMISNDWQRLMADLDTVEGIDERDREGREFLHYRLQAGLRDEPAQFLRESAGIREVRQFVDSLSEGVRRDHGTVLAGLHTETGHGSWFEGNRNRTSHYSVSAITDSRSGRRS